MVERLASCQSLCGGHKNKKEEKTNKTLEEVTLVKKLSKKEDLLGIDCQKIVDQVLGFPRYFIPIRTSELKFSTTNLVKQFLFIITKNGRNPQRRM